MKQVFKNKITNIPKTDVFDQQFLFHYLDTDFSHKTRKVVFLRDLLQKKKNQELFEKIDDRYAMYENVYSAKDELEIFRRLFEDAIKNNKKIHIVGVTLDEEIKILEKYYETLGFLREDINCFLLDFEKPLVTVSVHIENLMWRGSDYKKMKESIYFIPPIREAGQTKAMFKGINRGVITSISMNHFGEAEKTFLQNVVNQEHILPLMLGKVLCYNLDDMGYEGEKKELIISYN